LAPLDRLADAHQHLQSDGMINPIGQNFATTAQLDHDPPEFMTIDGDQPSFMIGPNE
jgi:hypothetical protein